MPLTVKVKSADVAVKADREATAKRVITRFGNRLPNARLLCFFDDNNWQPFKEYAGAANRGFYTPVKETTFAWPVWPDYVTEHILADDPPSVVLKRVFDHVIYLHGSTCANEIGLAMTFAHELQHFVQHSDVLKLWAENCLIQSLPRDVIGVLGLKWSDIPVEREARAVSKQTAEDLFGAERVRQHINTRITEALNADDAADWRFVQRLVPSTPYHLVDETRLIFRRLKDYRPNLEEVLQEVKENPDFKEVDLDALLG
jgi:hypothetical protein